MRVYSIYDVVARTYGPPVLFSNDQLAIRSTRFQFNYDKILCSTAKDYSLFCIGEFNVRNAEFTSKSPYKVVECLSLIEKKEKIMAKKFLTIYDVVKTKYTPSGTKNHPTYHAETFKNGVTELVMDTDKEGHPILDGWYDQIQSYKEGCSLETIIKRFKATQDPSVLQKRQGIYADVSGLPTSMIEMYRLVDKAKREFNSLPVDVRSEFKNDFAFWLANCDNAEFNKALNKDIVKSEPVLEKGESDNES